MYGFPPPPFPPKSPFPPPMSCPGLPRPPFPPHPSYIFNFTGLVTIIITSPTSIGLLLFREIVLES
ncbi:MAG TPA: hypothetical protein DF603_15750 [Chryseobacterium sp.]|nr:hypothetical protein [Chryseobacterium sp.]